MSNLHHSHALSGHFGASAGLFGLVRRIAKRIHDRRELNGLLKLDDHMLRDIGLQRGEIQSEAERPVWRG
jgi:uncharacterized protein YjiS (DUF1127 family)